MSVTEPKPAEDSALRDAFAEWQEWLDWFSQDLRSDIVEILHHLTPLLMAARPSDDGGLLTAPGLETVQRRGDYTHLLLSEWMLADTLPDEFLRRAAQHEHLFFTPPPYEEEGGRRIFALFDAGPQQLGLPRLVHLALMILLSRRATMLGGTFQWGILQENPPQWREFSQLTDLSQLLSFRTLVPVSPDMLESWKECLAQGDKRDECWLVSGTKFYQKGGIAFASHRLGVDETPGRNTLSVRLEQQGRSALEIAIPLPREKNSERLLAGKFTRKDQDKKASKYELLNGTKLLSPLTISPTGKKVMLQNRDEDNSIVEVDIKQGRLRIRRWSLPKAVRIVAAGYSIQEQLCMLLVRDNSYELWATDKKFPKGVLLRYEAKNSAQSVYRSQILCPMFDGENKGLVVRRGGDGCLTVTKQQNILEEQLIMENVWAVHHYSTEQMLVLSAQNGQLVLIVFAVGDSQKVASFDLGKAPAVGDCFIYHDKVENALYSGALIQEGSKTALNWSSKTMKFFKDPVTTDFVLPEGKKVIGAWFDNKRQVIVPVIWDRNKSIGLWRGHSYENWYSAPTKLARAEMSIVSGFIIMHDLNHRVIFFDAKNGCLAAIAGETETVSNE